MPQIVQLHRMASAQAATYIGPPGEIIGDLGANTLRYQDGATPGGFIVMQGSNNLSEVSSPSTALSHLGGAPLANPLFTGTAKVNGNVIVDASQLGVNVAIALSQAVNSSNGMMVLNSAGNVNFPASVGIFSTINCVTSSSTAVNCSGVTATVQGFTATGFGFSAVSDFNGSTTTTSGNGMEMVCISNGVVLTNGATSWAALSGREYKKNFEPIVNALDIIDNHVVELGHYNEDKDDRIKRPFIYYEDAVQHWPYATNHRKARTLTEERDVQVDEEHFHDDKGQITIQPVMVKQKFTKEVTEAKTVSQTDYIPLLMKAIQELRGIIKDQQQQIKNQQKEIIAIRGY